MLPDREIGVRGSQHCGVSWTALVCLVTLMSATSCKVSVSDLEKWRNRPGSEERFVQWMLDPESSDDVRAKAIEMLFEQYNYEGAEQLSRVGELPQQRRDDAIMDALPHIVGLYEGEQFTLGRDDLFRLDPVEVRDGAFVLLDSTETPEVRQALLGLIVRWLHDHYDACQVSVGRHTTADVLSAVGPEQGLGVFTNVIESGRFEQMLCQGPTVSQVSWLPETADQLAEAYINRWDTRRPQELENQLRLIDLMTRIPESRSMKNWILERQLANPESEIVAVSPEAVALFLDYVRPMAESEDARHFAQMVNIREGNVRWIAFEVVVELRGAEGLGMALEAIPDSGRWSRWGGRSREDGLMRAAFYICGRPIRPITAEARTIFESYLEDRNLVKRALAIKCLSEIGTEETVALLDPLIRNDSVIPAWGTENNTIGALAQEAIDAIQNR